MTYRVKLEVFEGPLDLLLHLIKKERGRHLRHPGRRASPTSTSRYLEPDAGHEPRRRRRVPGDGGDARRTSSRACCCRRRRPTPRTPTRIRAPTWCSSCVEYQRYREAALALGERPVLHARRLPARARRPGARRRRGRPSARRHARRSARGLSRGARALARARASTRSSTRRSRSRVRASVILRRLEMDGPLRFRDLFAGAPRRRRLVATFLALLELVKRQAHPRAAGRGVRRDPAVPETAHGKASHLDDVRVKEDGRCTRMTAGRARGANRAGRRRGAAARCPVGGRRTMDAADERRRRRAARRGRPRPAPTSG